MATNKNTTSFAQRTAERLEQENQWQNYNAEAEFDFEMTNSLGNLAKQIFPFDDFNSKAYQEATVKSLTETIFPEIGVKDFWQAMGEKECKIVRIIEGRLNFFDKKNQKIDITSFTQPIIFEAHSSYYKQRQVEREQRIAEARQQLQELIEEINQK